jgi:hypothetical protein
MKTQFTTAHHSFWAQSDCDVAHRFRRVRFAIHHEPRLTVLTTNSPAPVVVNGQYAVTNPISGTPQYFRLSQ